MTWAVDFTLDSVVLLLASWTVVYEVCLVLHLTAAWAVVIECVALVGWFAAARARSPRPHSSEPVKAVVPTRSLRPFTGLTALTVTAATGAAIAMAFNLPWAFVWVSWLIAACAGTGVAARQLAAADRTRPETPTTDVDTAQDVPRRGTVSLVLGWAVSLTVLSMFILRPNPDDLFYVNVSQWVAEHGTFPTRDTLFADLQYPMANWPPVASYDPLAGTIAHLAGTPAATIVYIFVTPIATLLSVLALWRLLRAWHVPNVEVALSAALVFLLFDGGPFYGPPGNLFLTRLWQGKVILLCLMVPLLLVYAIRYVERPSRARAGRLFLGGVAAVGLSTTAIFLVPCIAAAGAAPLLRRSRRHALIGFIAMASFPLATGVVTIALGGRSADDFGGRRLYRFDPVWFGHEIFIDGVLALIAVGAVLLGPLLVVHREARVTTGLLVVVTGVTFIPGVTQLSYDAIGLGPTLWRLSWVASIAALVGVLASWVAVRLRGRWTAAAAVLLSLGLLIGLGSPIWASDSTAAWVAPFHWQRGDGTRNVANAVIRGSLPGDVVLAPDDLAITFAVTTTQIKTVAPRDYYMDYLRHASSFHFRRRLALVDFVNHQGPWDIHVVSRDLHALGVDRVCVYAEDVRRYHALLGAGLIPDVRTSRYKCLHP